MTASTSSIRSTPHVHRSDQSYRDSVLSSSTSHLPSSPPKSPIYSQSYNGYGYPRNANVTATTTAIAAATARNTLASRAHRPLLGTFGVAFEDGGSVASSPSILASSLTRFSWRARARAASSTASDLSGSEERDPLDFHGEGHRDSISEGRDDEGFIRPAVRLARPSLERVRLRAASAGAAETSLITSTDPPTFLPIQSQTQPLRALSSSLQRSISAPPPDMDQYNDIAMAAWQRDQAQPPVLSASTPIRQTASSFGAGVGFDSGGRPPGSTGGRNGRRARRRRRGKIEESSSPDTIPHPFTPASRNAAAAAADTTPVGGYDLLSASLMFGDELGEGKTQHSAAAPPEAAPKLLRVYAATWNMGNPTVSPPDAEVAAMLGLAPAAASFSSARTADINVTKNCDAYVIGAQEGLRRAHVWQVQLQRVLGASYALMHAHSLAGIQLCVFLHKDLLWYASGVESAHVATKLAGVLKTKGGVGICLDFLGTSLLFVTSHLTAHDQNVAERNADFRTICRTLGLPHAHRLKREFALLSPSKRIGEDLTAKFDRIVWMGDLNYRVDLPRAQAETLAKEGQLEPLLAHDQLIRQRAQKRVFMGFDEAPIAFAPTFKFDVGTNTYDTSAKQRVPSWTDRILFRSRNSVHGGGTVEAPSIVPLAYGCVLEAMSSDHKPVYAVLEVPLDTQALAHAPPRMPLRHSVWDLGARFDHQVYVKGILGEDASATATAAAAAAAAAATKNARGESGRHRDAEGNGGERGMRTGSLKGAASRLMRTLSRGSSGKTRRPRSRSRSRSRSQGHGIDSSNKTLTSTSVAEEGSEAETRGEEEIEQDDEVVAAAAVAAAAVEEKKSTSSLPIPPSSFNSDKVIDDATLALSPLSEDSQFVVHKAITVEGNGSRALLRGNQSVGPSNARSSVCVLQ